MMAARWPLTQGLKPQQGKRKSKQRISMLKRSDIFSSNGHSTARVRKVPTPEWSAKGHVFVRMLPASELPSVQRIQEKAASGKTSEAALAAWWCVLGVCDAKGKRLFKDSDHSKLLNEPLGAVARCAMEFADLNFRDEAGRKKN